MAVDSCWDKREAAQKVVEECAGLRKRIEPLRTAENQLGDLQLMAELGAEEDEATQTTIVAEVEADAEKFIADLDALELAFEDEPGWVAIDVCSTYTGINFAFMENNSPHYLRIKMSFINSSFCSFSHA